MRMILHISNPSFQKNIWPRCVFLATLIGGMLACADTVAGDIEGIRFAQMNKQSMPPAGATAKTSSDADARGKEKKSPEKKKIRTRSIQPEQPLPGTAAPLEKAPSIDADAQKGLVDRMKGCCDAPKN